MRKLVIGCTEGDLELAQGLKKSLRCSGYAVSIDSGILKTSWDRSWAEAFPDVGFLVLIVTDSFHAAFSEAFGAESPSRAVTFLGENQEGLIPVLVGCTQSLGSLPVKVPWLYLGSSADLHALGRHLNRLVARPALQPLVHMSVVGVVLLLLSHVIYWVLHLDALYFYQRVVVPLYMTVIGATGAVAYSLFNVLGILPDGECGPEGCPESYVRLILGGLSGWISFVVLENTSYAELDSFQAIAMVVALLCGFSGKLVIGLVNQGSRIVERAVGILEAPQTNRKEA